MKHFKEVRWVLCESSLQVIHGLQVPLALSSFPSSSFSPFSFSLQLLFFFFVCPSSAFLASPGLFLLFRRMHDLRTRGRCLQNPAFSLFFQQRGSVEVGRKSVDLLLRSELQVFSLVSTGTTFSPLKNLLPQEPCLSGDAGVSKHSTLLQWPRVAP